MDKEREAFDVWLRSYIESKPDLWDMEDYEKDSMFDAWQAKAQAVPEGKYILQTFSTYSGVCEDTFNHKNIGVFESIDAAMFHARNIGLVMNHYGYEFRVIEAQEPK